MFLIDRPAVSPSLRADLAPRVLLGGAGDAIRAALAAGAPVAGLAAPLVRQPSPGRAPARAAAARRRKAG
jgi:hypothetical protein